jgi:hypothetical protein
VNLSAFETFFEEKRPFFVAGSGIFNFGNANCYFCSNFSSIESFYSRRIGRSPQGASIAYDAGEFADVPENSTILGAAKITGRTSKGVTVGLLNALTRREVANVLADDGTGSKHEVEPLTNYLVGRATKDYLGGNLVVGGIGTSVVRRLGDSLLRDRLTTHAESFGGDLVYTWDKKNYQLLASAMISNVAGDSAAMERVQRSSARYFQRPDRAVGGEGLFRSGFLNSSYRPGATNLRGLASYVRLAKDGGNFNWEAQSNVRTPGFEVNDISFLSRADYAQFVGNVAYNWTKPTKWYRDAVVIAGAQQSQNFDGDLTNRDVHAFIASGTPQYWRWSLWALHNFQVYDDRLMRGGPLGVLPAGDVFSGSVSTDSRRRVVLNVNPRFQRNSEGGFQSAVKHLAPLEAGVERLAELRPVVQPHARRPAVRHERGGPDGHRVRGKPLRLLVARAEDALDGHADRRDVHAELDARDVRAAVHRVGRLLGLQGVRRAAPGAQERLWTRPRHDHADVGRGTASSRRTPSTRTRRAPPRRSPSTTRASTRVRSWATSSTAGSTVRARRSTSCGRSRAATSSRTSAISTSRAIVRRCSRRTRITSSW